MGAFSERVFTVVTRIPKGKVATYGQVARLIGAPRSARYVGYALRSNPAPGVDADSIPCHRVVFKDGRLCTGFAFGGPGEQRRLLEAEGVGFDDNGRVDLEYFQWNGVPEGEDSASSEMPLAPPADFDWEAELAENPIHDCDNCRRPHCDRKRPV